jgi:hypothetical protein
MPVILGLVIVETNFVDAGIVVLVLSMVQLLITLLFKPTVALPRTSGSKNIWQTIKKYRGRGVFSKLMLAQSRGLFASMTAYLIVPILFIHDLGGSDLDLGLYTSLGAILFLIYVWLYQLSKRHLRLRRRMLIFASLALIIMPLVCIVYPSLPSAIVLYLVMIIFASGLFNTLAATYNIDIVEAIPSQDKFDVDVLSECFLNVGRMIVLGGFLAIVLCGASMPLILLYCSVTALASLLFIRKRIIRL